MNCPLCEVKKNFDLLIESSSTYLVYDNYGLHYGHLLIIPKVHVLNMSLIFDSASQSIHSTITHMQSYFNTDIAVYEHGNTEENKKSNISIDHAHLHILPIIHQRHNLFDAFKSNTKTYDSTLDDFYISKAERPYHLLSINGMEAVYSYEKLPSEFFRKIYSDCENISLWDWKKDGIEIKRRNGQYYYDKYLLKKALFK